MANPSRKRRVVACETCRGRRTKCDGRRPACSYCHAHGADCTYREDPSLPRSGLEVDLAGIHKRLEHITGLLVASQSQAQLQTEYRSPGQTSTTPAGRPHAATTSSAFAPSSPLTPGSHEPASDGSKFPFMIIKNQPMMKVLALDPDTARWLVNADRNASEPTFSQQTGGNGLPRMLMLQSQHVMAALAAFSEQVHTWYPMFSTDFTEAFSHSISNPNSHPVESCLTMLVVAIGSLASMRDTETSLTERPDLVYYEAAVALLPTAIQGYSLSSLQCLVLFSIYQLCLIRPCQAHDYITMASFRAQNMLRSRAFTEGSDEDEGLRRAFWTILLVESEISIQMDLPESGIWAYDDISLPANSEPWHFPSPSGNMESMEASPQSQTSAPLDSVLVYFLAEIAMRRMLQRCTTSVSKSAGGRLRYAPLIAIELELQLNEWYNCLPGFLRFHVSPTNRDEIADLPAAQFLQTQYFACKASIYWPAVYQAMELSAADDGLLQYCTKFFDSFVSFVLAASLAVKTCLVNTWTLNSSLFIIGMAARKAATIECLQATINPHVQECVILAQETLAKWGNHSPSLAALSKIMEETNG